MLTQNGAPLCPNGVLTGWGRLLGVIGVPGVIAVYLKIAPDFCSPFRRKMACLLLDTARGRGN
jgi:hypothetical protein